MRALDLQLLLLLDKLSFGFEISELGDELLADERAMHVGLLLQKRNGGFELGDGGLGGRGFRLFLRLLPLGGRDLGAPLLGLAQEIIGAGRQEGQGSRQRAARRRRADRPARQARP